MIVYNFMQRDGSSRMQVVKNVCKSAPNPCKSSPCHSKLRSA